MATEKWWTAPAEDDQGNTVIVSGREIDPRYPESGKYNDRIELRWTYTPGPGGMPDDDTAALMEQADAALREALDKEKACLLTGVYTGAGQRDWVIYTKNPRIFQSLLNRAWAALPLLPVQIYAEKDPGWAEYREMRENTYIPDAD